MSTRHSQLLAALMKHLLIATFLAAQIYSLPAYSEDIQEFITKSQVVGKKYQDIADSTQSLQLYKNGKKNEVNASLNALVSDNNKTVYDYFILSNMLYRADRSISKSYMEKANELSPNNPYILLELGMREHRAGNCSAALPLYAKAATLFEKSRPNLWSYITHCHLSLGNYAAAIESWSKVDFRNNHIKIEKAMYEIFSIRNPDSERDMHISSVYVGKPDAVCELVELDRRWEVDWWNLNENKVYLNHDISLVKSLSKKNKELQIPIDLCVDSVVLNDEAFSKYISDSGYWGKSYILPEGPMATYFLIRELKNRELATPAAILAHYEDQLVKRHTADPDNLRTLDILANLYSSTENNEKLKKIDDYGWKKLGNQKYAESYIHGITTTDPEFRDAVEAAAVQFPNSAIIQKAYLTLHQQSELRERALMKYVAAEFANVKNSLRSKFRLSDYMASLKHEMEASTAGK